MGQVRAALAARLTDAHKQLLVEMEQISREYSEHQKRILQKFVSIIAESIDASGAQLASTDWHTARRPTRILLGVFKSGW